ncbi:MAG: response regulator, partial [Gemmatimonadaceae bacterium]
GYTVHSATTGGEALESILRLSPPPDLALVDVNLPDGDGMEFARRLRTVRPTLHILLTSGSAGSVAPHDDEFAFLPKPFGAAELAQAVRDVLDRGHT